jgi:hypothetical protein
MISLYPPDSPYTIYKEEAWWSDEWDAMEYGQEVDLSRSFFEQFGQLRRTVPRRGMQRDSTSENSDYATYGLENRDCYLAFACGLCQDVYYSAWVVMSKSCVDCLSCFDGELLYECIDCDRCYACAFSYDCKSCQDSWFLENCRNCHHCIGCKNLRNKSYHVFNSPVPKEEFERLRCSLSEGGCEDFAQKFEEWRCTLPTLFTHIENSENCTGNSIENARNCYECFDILLGAEDLRYCQYCGWKGKDMVDCSFTGKTSELLYEVMTAITGQRCGFCTYFRTASDSYYCEGIARCQHCFGCIGLNDKKFCILNRQYTEEEYFEILPRLIEHMQKTKEWGENIPIQYSPFPYNDTLAYEFFPLEKSEALSKGYTWNDQHDESIEVEHTIPAHTLPDSIGEVPDDVLNWAIVCEATGKPFKIIRRELEFYRQLQLPLPHIHPMERHRRRRKRRNPHRLWDRECVQCGKQLRSPYAPDRPDRIFCESCYLDAMYGPDAPSEPQEYSLRDESVHKIRTSYKTLTRRAGAAKKILRRKIVNR